MQDERIEPSEPARPVTSASAYTAEAFFKKQLDATNKEKAQLQERLRHVEEQNKALLKSLFELSCAPSGPSASHQLPLDIVSALRKLSAPSEAPISTASGKGSAFRRSGTTTDRLTSAPFGTGHGLRPHVSTAYTPFRHRVDLRGHSSAVYAVQFSPDGRLLVSVSFDRSVRLWPIEQYLDRRPDDASLSIMDAHRAPIVAVEWALDATHVVTGALDQSIAEWDVETMCTDAIVRFPCHGLVNCVSMSPAHANVFYVGTARSAVHSFDRRIPPAPGATAPATVVVRNDAAVNTVHVTLDGRRVITGDHGGAIKTWDVRMAASNSSSSIDSHGAGASDIRCTPVCIKFNDARRRPITHIHTSPPLPGEEHGRFMAVNSYDAYLRVYERGALLFPAKDVLPLSPVHALRGVINAHWPIKSSFFLGADYRPPPRRQRFQHQRRPRRGGEARSARSDPSVGNDAAEEAHNDGAGIDDDKFCSPSDDAEDDATSSAESEDEEDVPRVGGSENGPSATAAHSQHDDDDGHTVGDAIQNALILASGSADGHVYVFDVGARSGRGALLQTLEGHKDRVYTADFHPNQPMLASCSADSDIKIWHARYCS